MNFGRIDRLNAWLVSALLILAPVAAEASQNQLSSPTTGTVSGLNLTNNYNNAIDSLNTQNSGATSPVNQLSGAPSLGNWWLNTTAAPYGLSMYDGASNWPVMGNIDPAAHAWNLQIGGGVATLASASTVDLCSTPRNYLTISGTTTINSFGSTCPAGVVKLVTFSGALTLNYNATSLVIPGAANVQTSAGDQATVVALGGGNWQVASYTPANGQALINPAIDVGAYVFTSAVTVPSSKYLLAYGQAISRTTYATYLAAVTITQSVTATSGSPTLTGFSDTTQVAAGAAIEASFIPNGTTIASCTSTTCTLSANATTSTTGNATIFPYGNGCGFGTSCSSPSTVFNMPDCRDVVMAGRGNMGGTTRSDSYALTSTYFGASPNALGTFGGSQSKTLVTANLPAYTPSGSVAVTFPGGNEMDAVQVGFGNINIGGSGSGGNPVQIAPATQTFTGTAQGGTSTPFSTVPPTLTMNCMVRVLTLLDPPTSQRFAAINDNGVNPLAIVDRRRHAA